MMEANPDVTLDAPPAVDTIEQYRKEAEERGDSFIAAFPNAEQEQRYLVVSPRGTCVLLDANYSEDTFNPSVSAEAVAEAIAG